VIQTDVATAGSLLTLKAHAPSADQKWSAFFCIFINAAALLVLNLTIRSPKKAEGF